MKKRRKVSVSAYSVFCLHAFLLFFLPRFAAVCPILIILYYFCVIRVQSKMINFSDFLKSLTIFHHLKRPSDPLLTQHLYDLQLLCRQSTKYSHFYDIRSCPSSLKTIIIMFHFRQSIFTTSSWQVPRSFWAILTSGDNPRAN